MEKPPVIETTEKIRMENEFEIRRGGIVDIIDGVEVNASGHKDELVRQYSIWSLCGLGLVG
jgi:choline transport protein